MNQAIDSIKLSLKTLQGICFALLVFWISPQPHIKYENAIRELKNLKDYRETYYYGMKDYLNEKYGFVEYRNQLKQQLANSGIKLRYNSTIDSLEFGKVISPQYPSNKVSKYLEYFTIVVQAVDKKSLNKAIDTILKFDFGEKNTLAYLNLGFDQEKEKKEP